MTKTKLIRNASAIVTCDSADTVHHDADILVENGMISKIAPKIAVPDAEIIDAAHKIIYPGLINTHHHFFQTFVRNLVSIDYPNMLVVEWLDKIYRIFQAITSDVIFYSSITAMSDLIKHGCTCAFDHQYCYTNLTGNSPVDRQMEAADLLGIRYHAGRGTNTLPNTAGSTIPDNMLETTDAFLRDCERIIDLYHDPNPGSMRQIVMAPCQPINSYPETFIETIPMARAKGVRMHTHLGEGENPIMVERWGKRSLEWCEEIGFIGNDVWFAHFWEGTDEEFQRLSQAGSGISHCPTPAVLGGFPILDLQKLNSIGVNTSLGCDGSATNDSSNLLDSMRIAYLMQTWHSKQRGGSVSAYDILKTATVEGAKTLGRQDLGSLEVGKCADMFLIDMDVPELVGTAHDPKNLIARAGLTGPVWMTIIGGEPVYRDGRLQGIDEQAYAEMGEKVCDRDLRIPFKHIYS